MPNVSLGVIPIEIEVCLFLLRFWKELHTALQTYTQCVIFTLLQTQWWYRLMSCLICGDFIVPY